MAGDEGAVRVVCVDDDPDLGQLTADALEREADDLEAVVERSASAGLDRIESEPIDCVVSDYEMPGQDGLEFLATVREDHPDLPFILFTGRGSEEIASEAISAGVTDYLQKGSGTDQYAILANRVENAVERARTERALRESEQRYRTLIEGSADAILIGRGDEVAFVNRRTTDLTGYDEATLLEMNWWELIHPEDRERVRDYERRRKAGEDAPERYDARLVTAEGAVCHVEVSARRIVYEGEPATLGMLRDVTERVEREAELKLIRTLLDRSNDGVYVVDPADGEILDVNETVCRNLGYDREELIGMTVPEIGTTVPDAAAWDEQVDALRERGTATVRGEHRRRDGSTYPVEVSSTYVSLERDYILAIARDVSDRREREQRLDALHGATRDLMTAETHEEICGIVVDAAADVLEYPVAAVVVPDEGEGFRSVAATETAAELFPNPPSFRGERGLIATAFADGEPLIVDDVRTHPAAADPDNPVRSVGIFPLGEHGAVVIGDCEPDAFGSDAEFFGKLLAANAQAALDRAAREAELAETNRRLEALIEATPAPIVMLDTEARVELWNPAAEQLFGWEPEAVVGERLPILPDDHNLSDTFERVIDGETIEDEPVVRRTRDGERKEMLLSAAPITDVEGSVTGAVGVLVDVSDRLDYERTVERLHAATRDLIGAERTGEILDRGRVAIEEILGFGQAAIRLYDPDAEALVLRELSERSAELLGDRPTYDLDGSSPGRAYRTNESVLVDVEPDDAYGRDPLEQALYIPMEGWGVISVGTTDPEGFSEADVKLIEILASNVAAALSRAEREADLREQNERLESFASVVSHDLRNPLNVAQGYLELAAAETDGTDGADERLDRIGDALERMERLIEDLLALARQGDAVDEPEVVRLSTAVDAAWAAVDAPAATIRIEDDAAFMADPDRLSQLFENLFRNAVEHAGEDVTVRVGGLADGFYVADDGPGVPADERERVFESGYSTSADGVGLGLAIVRRIADAHGWSTGVVDGEAGGARFEIRGVEAVDDPAAAIDGG